MEKTQLTQLQNTFGQLLCLESEEENKPKFSTDLMAYISLKKQFKNTLINKPNRL